MYCITENKRGVLSLNWHLPIHPRALSKGSLCFTQEDIPCTANVNWFPAIVMSPCSSKSRDPDGANIWEEHCLIWFWGSLWVACIRVWEQGNTCNGMAYKHTDTSTSIHNVYTSIHTRAYIRVSTRAETRGIAPPLTSLRSFLPTFYCQIWALLSHLTICTLLLWLHQLLLQQLQRSVS